MIATSRHSRRLALLAALASVLGCVSTDETTKSLELERPRTSGGLILRDSPTEWAERWSELLAARDRQRQGNTRESGDPESASTPPPAEPSAEARTKATWPPGTGRLIDLPRLSRTELVELTDALVRHLETEVGYSAAEPDVAAAIPPLPEGAEGDRLLMRDGGDAPLAVRLGYWRYQARAPQFVFRGVIVRDGELTPSPDLPRIEEMLQTALAAFEEARANLKPQDLESRIIQLSYVDTAGAMSAMKGLGYSTFEAGAELPPELEFDRLPIVVELPAPKGEATGLIGAKSDTGESEFGSTVVPTIASDMGTDVIASPMSRLLVLFHPAHPDQFSRVKQLLDEVIDRPARQVFVECMVLEISSIGLEELGIEWEFRENKWDIIVGALTAGLPPLEDSLNVLGAKSQDFDTDWMATIRALITDGKAEILSRPSVLTLNNRQATIRIGQDFPIATSQEGLQGDASKISFDFKYLALGILLNIRPRINEDGSEISLLVDTMVSSIIPGAGLEIRDENGTLLASAPTVDSRRVQTYARVPNNTPFVVGGLVSRNKTEIHEKVPILGDIPILGLLFRSKSSTTVRREVIIVLTPYVIPEESHFSRALPKGDLIESKDLNLFRDTPRILTEDIADVSFLYRNQRFQTYRDLAREAIREDFRIAEREPFRSFRNRRLPGEQVLVHRIFYNVLDRLRMEERVRADRIVVLTGEHTGGYEVAFLERVLRIRGVSDDYESFFTDHADKALALTFNDPGEATSGESLAGDPVPEMSIVDCPDREEWGRLMWELNQPDPNGRRRYTILLNSEEDLIRLRLAILVKFSLFINGAFRDPRVLDYIPGRVLEIPEPGPGHPHILDAEIARLFSHSVHFYAATIQEIEKALLRLDRELRSPDWQHLLEGIEPPSLEERR